MRARDDVCDVCDSESSCSPQPFDSNNGVARCKNILMASIAMSHDAANSLRKRLRAGYVPFNRKVNECGGLIAVVGGEEFYVVQPIAHENQPQVDPTFNFERREPLRLCGRDVGRSGVVV